MTTTVVVEGGNVPLLSVKTDKPVPKNLMLVVMDSLADVSVEAPIDVGDVIVADILGTGSNIVATRKINKDSRRPSFS